MLGIYKKKQLFITNSPISDKHLRESYSLDKLLLLEEFSLHKTTQIIYLSGIPLNHSTEYKTKILSKNNKWQIVENYKKKGKVFFKEWEGCWSVGLWDAKKSELILARDKMGNARIYYYDSIDYFIFSDKLSSLLNLPFIPKELNSNAILQHGYGLKRDSQTYYKNINQLPKAHYLIIKNGQVEINAYWIPEIRRSIRYKKIEDYVEHFNEIECVTNRL